MTTAPVLAMHLVIACFALAALAVPVAVHAVATRPHVLGGIGGQVAVVEQRACEQGRTRLTELGGGRR